MQALCALLPTVRARARIARYLLYSGGNGCYTADVKPEDAIEKSLHHLQEEQTAAPHHHVPPRPVPEPLALRAARYWQQRAVTLQAAGKSPAMALQRARMLAERGKIQLQQALNASFLESQHATAALQQCRENARRELLERAQHNARWAAASAKEKALLMAYAWGSLLLGIALLFTLGSCLS